MGDIITFVHMQGSEIVETPSRCALGEGQLGLPAMGMQFSTSGGPLACALTRTSPPPPTPSPSTWSPAAPQTVFRKPAGGMPVSQFSSSCKTLSLFSASYLNCLTNNI